MQPRIRENYVKAIYKLCQKNKEGAYTNDIALALQVKAGTVSESLKKLSEEGFIVYYKHRAVKLSAKGQQLALRIIRRHRLWEVFLVEKLGFGWDEIHPMAEELEHIDFDQLTDRLDVFLDKPSVDPHGDPIPDKNGKLSKVNYRNLTACSLHEYVSMVGIENHQPSFLQLLDQLGLRLGTKLLIKEIIPFDGSMLVKIGKKEFYLSKTVSENILVGPHKE
ncbi:MAG: metal-dependent transcriptional regulator [Cytophagaceae bacterium]|nr:metal-dependent transcriptional regulator [Cytophagaceae bacterium]